MTKRKRLQVIIDLDGVIAEEKPTFERPLAKPIAGAKKSVNSLFEEGHTIVLYSARSWSEYLMTENWLKKNGIKYHQLIMGKPVGDVWIDDRAVKFISWNETMSEINQIYGRKRR